MRKTVVLTLALSMAASFASLGEARGPKAKAGPPGPAWHRGCLSLEQMDLSEKQRSELERITAEYSAQVARMREELLERRLEVETLLRGPDAKEGVIRAKAAELVRAHNRLQERMIEYQLSIRSLLTPEQLKRWCTLMGPGPGQGRWGMP